MTEEELKKEETATGEEPAVEETETAAEAPQTEEAEEKSGKADKKAARKKADKERDAMKEQIAGLEDRVKRQMAEFENFRKRTDREKDAMYDMGARSVLEKILPIVDNFERGFATVQEEDQEDAFVVGMNGVYKQLMTELDKIGVKPIEAVGQPFDPNFHNAVMQCESDEYESGVVAMELQKGYMYKDVVLRHSMVSVVQ
jgi:molecular chaperone GrpE